ncbi:MAG: DNA polymerase III subunit alpha [Phycisphaerae bacterium]
MDAPTEDFVHLHVHSHYSLLDGACRPEKLVQAAVDSGMDALALTDHGNLFGAAEFYKLATGAGIKPILGLEAYISPTTRHDRSMGNPATAAYHLLLLAMDITGWRNLMKLSSRAYTEGFYYRPRVDRELLAELNEGLICTTACLGGEVPAALLSGQAEQARRIAGEYRDIFGSERFFIEIQNHQLPEQQQINPELIRLARELGVGLVGTNDVHFLQRSDKQAHEVLTCISTGKTLSEQNELAYSPELYFKDGSEMRRALKDYPGAADATRQIAEMCDVKLDFSSRHLPHFPTPQGQDPDSYLRKLAEEGLSGRFDGNVPKEYAERLNWELNVIADKGYSSYFLIVNDFVRYARDNNIPAGPRGSGVATLLGYSLGIQNVDPMRYGLLFERFTDPAREEAPDMDIDLCQDGRADVIRYVREKYGHVAQIITYGTLKARAAVRDVGRVMGIPLPEVDAIARKVPEGPKVTLDGALESEPELRQAYESDARIRELLDYARKLEGLARHAGVHAAGVIVCDEPLENIVPLCRQADSEDPITQWDGPTCDEIGLMKMDFLGLRTLSILGRCRDLIRHSTGRDIDPETLPLNDPEVYRLFCDGLTDGVFQFESEGMKAVLRQMRPERIGDLIAANAMYRPGPMELIPAYCARKNGTEEVPGIHPLVDDMLAETYGIMVYQEQVMQVLERLGKIPLNRALTLVKAISKKKTDLIAEERGNFLSGAEENGIDRAEAERLFELILKFGGYGFNKAHSTRYALVAYQSAYFKVHYPREFFAATLTYECVDTDKVVQYMAEAERFGVTVAPPDINTCGADFTVDGELVRFGLAAVRGVGARAVDAIVAAREEQGSFRDLYHFCESVDLRAVNRIAIEALIKCGAFDALGASRAEMVAALDRAIELGQAAAEDRRSGQLSIFQALGGDDQKSAPGPRFPRVEPWSESELLAAEKETLGFYITSHPLTRYVREQQFLGRPAGVRLSDLENYTGPLTIGVMIASIRRTVTRKQQKPMAVLTVEDVSGQCEAVVFPETYENYRELINEEAMVFLRGTVDRRRERANIIVEEIIPMDAAVEQLTGAMLLRLPAGADDDMLASLAEVLRRHGGARPVRLEITPRSRPDVRAQVSTGDGFRISPSRTLMNELGELLGEQNVVLEPVSAPQNNSRRRNYRAPAGAR